MAGKVKKSRGLYLRGDIWHYDFVVDGQRYRGSTKETEKTRARAVLETLKTEARQGKDINQKAMRFFDLLELFFKVRDPEKPSRKNEQFFSRTLKAYFGNIPIKDIDPQMINGYISARLNGELMMNGKQRPPVKRTSINRELTFLRTVLNYAVNDIEVLHRSPFRRGMISTRAESEAKRLEHYLTVEEIKKYLNACNPAYYHVARAAIECGMRRGEILNLKWKDVNFEDRLFYIKKSKSGKTRTVPVSESMIAQLRGMHAQSRSEYVFTNTKGEKYECVKKVHQTALNRAGLGDKDITFHDLRRTAGTLHYRMSGDIHATSILLGHSSIQQTQTYLGFDCAQNLETVETVSNLIDDPQCHKNVTIGNFAEKGKASKSAKKALST